MNQVNNAFINKKDSYIDIEELKKLVDKNYGKLDDEIEEFKVDNEYMYNPAKYLTGMNEVGDVVKEEEEAKEEIIEKDEEEW